MESEVYFSLGGSEVAPQNGATISTPTILTKLELIFHCAHLLSSS
jgi:hypothetical protein